MQCYLTDLNWHDNLFFRAREDAGMSEVHEVKDESAAKEPLGASWVVYGSAMGYAYEEGLRNRNPT